MPKHKAIHLAIDKAIRHRDDMAVALAQALQAVEFAHAQQAQLQGYADETDTRLSRAGGAALSPEIIRHHYQFVDRLQQAIAMQADVIANAQDQVENARANLAVASHRVLGLEQVLKTRQAQEMVLLGRREQRQMDEYAALQFARVQRTRAQGETL
jgi:flagellar protein FliJ